MSYLFQISNVFLVLLLDIVERLHDRVFRLVHQIRIEFWSQAFALKLLRVIFAFRKFAKGVIFKFLPHHRNSCRSRVPPSFRLPPPPSLSCPYPISPTWISRLRTFCRVSWREFSRFFHSRRISASRRSSWSNLRAQIRRRKTRRGLFVWCPSFGSHSIDRFGASWRYLSQFEYRNRVLVFTWGNTRIVVVLAILDIFVARFQTQGRLLVARRGYFLNWYLIIYANFWKFTLQSLGFGRIPLLEPPRSFISDPDFWNPKISIQ